MLKKLPKRACPELAEGFNRSFIVGSSSPTKLWLLYAVLFVQSVCKYAGVGYGNLPSSGNYVFRKNLNLGDIITINVNKNFDFPTNTGNNKVKIEKIQ